MGHMYLSNISEFFLKRLYAKGSLSITDTVIALKAAGETVHTANGEYEDAEDYQMAMVDLILYLRQGHKVHEFSLENFTRAALGKEKKLKAFIIPTDLTDRQRKNLVEYDDGGDVWENWDEADWCEFEHIKWKYAPGWRMKYQKIPRLNQVTH